MYSSNVADADGRLLGLRAIDASLREIAGKGTPGRRRLRFFFAATLQALDGFERTVEDDSLLDELFSHERSKDERGFVAVSLLRLLAVAPEAFSDQRFIGKSEQLWDQQLLDVYKNLGLSVSDSGFDKRKALQDAVPRALSDLNRALEDLGGVTDANSLQTVRRHLRQALGRHASVVDPFLPAGLLRVRLDELFTLAIAVFEAEDHSLLAAFQNAWDSCKAYEEEAAEYDTDFSRDILAAFARELGRQLERTKSQRTLHDAVLRVDGSGRRYPLHEPARVLRLRLGIKNTGKGPASEVVISIEAAAGLELEQTEIYVGSVRTGSHTAEVAAMVESVEGPAEIIGVIRWLNADGSPAETPFDVRFQPQRSDVQWGALDEYEPYSLSPIEDPAELFGRDSLIKTLVAALSKGNMTSFVVSGQKRVGKTSIALSVGELMRTAESAQYIVAYLQVGKFKASPKGLYRGISKAIVDATKPLWQDFPGLQHLERPGFDDGFVEFLDFVDEVLALDESLRLVLILDEFDELPTRLYQLNDEAGAFFNILREFVAQPRRALVLVGGERLNFVLQANGAALNLLSTHRVDQFRRDDQMGDFSRLVAEPASGVLEFEPEAIEALFSLVDGHPYFAKMVCRSILRSAIERRETTVTASEVDDAAADALHEAGVMAFTHFWDDGIFESDPVRLQGIALNRRLALIALARAMASEAGPTKPQLEEEASRVELPASDLNQAISSLQQRRVLLSSGEAFVPRVPFFGRWLEAYGQSEIVSELTDPKVQSLIDTDRAAAVVPPHEIAALVKSWGIYRNRSVTGEQVRAWLTQFGGSLNQRRAMTVLKSARLYSHPQVKQAFAAGHASLVSGVRRTLAPGATLFTDVLVVPLRTANDAGWGYGTDYAREARIHLQNVVTPEQLGERLEATKRDIRFVVFVDDFIGSGGFAKDRLSTLPPSVLERLRSEDLEVALVVAVGFDQGVKRVRAWAKKAVLPMRVVVGETLDDQDRIFSRESRLFEEASERSATRELFERIGRLVQPNAPLGFNDGEALVVFETGVPNHTLPHLWSEGTAEHPWVPLFPNA